MKSAFAGCNFTEPHELVGAIRDVVGTISEKQLKSVFDSRIERERRVIAQNQEYCQS
jgi:hypothetical protein